MASGAPETSELVKVTRQTLGGELLTSSQPLTYALAASRVCMCVWVCVLCVL